MLVARGGFWRARERDETWRNPDPARWPDVVAIIPARDEAECVGQCVGSLLSQNYPGHFSIVLVDDESADGTGDVASAAARALRRRRTPDHFARGAAAGRLERQGLGDEPGI